MWKYPWNYKEGIAICIGLFITGALLQSSVGEIDLEQFKYPLNLIYGGIYLILLLGVGLFGRKNKYILWFSQSKAALTSLGAMLLLVVLMGSIRQNTAPSSVMHAHHMQEWGLGFNRMTRSWVFGLQFLYFLSVIGLVTIRRVLTFKFGWKDCTFVLNHLGLFIALFAGVLGSSDLQRLRMQTSLLKPEWRATNDAGELKELPIAIELKSFDIDQYPPKLFAISNQTGKVQPEGHPQAVLVEDSIVHGQLLDWDIEVTNYLPMAAAMHGKDSTKYVNFMSHGATSAVYVKAYKKGVTKEGWVSCGNYMFPHCALTLDKDVSIVMPVREPKQYSSSVDIFIKDGDGAKATIEVNKPLAIAGWKIYQVSYDESMGRWSNISVFELVRDPWLPYVYTGICMMLLGALGLFFVAKKKEYDDNVE